MMDKKIKKIIFLDLDNTLIKNPDPAESLKIWLQTYGEKHPNIGWWNHPDSLNFELFNFELIQNVVDHFQNIRDDETLTVLLTNRPDTLEKEVKNLLQFFDIKLDLLTFKTKPIENKSERVLKIISEYPNIKNVYFYDDLYGHLIEVEDQLDSPIYSNIIYKAFLIDNFEIKELL